MQLLMAQTPMFSPSARRLRHLSTLRSISPALINMAYAECEALQLEQAVMIHDMEMLKFEAEMRGRKTPVCSTTDDPEHKVLYPLGIWNPRNRPGPDRVQ